MPSETAPQDRVWMAFPTGGYTLGDTEEEAHAARSTWAAVANAVLEFEPVTMVVAPDDVETAARYLDPRVEVLTAELNDAWMRDIGPSFVLDANKQLGAVDWIFNGWGAQDWAAWGLDAERAGTELRNQDGGTRKDEVTGQDGDGVAPDLVGRRRPAAERRGVHDVVVVQRGEVRQFDDDGGLHHGGQGGVAKVGAQQGQQRADALAAGFHEVTRRCVSQGIGIGNGFAQPLLDARQVGGNRGTQLGVARNGREACRQLEAGGDRRGVEVGFRARQAVSGVRPALVCRVGHGLTLTFVAETAELVPD